jgi:hypothetical protein
MWNPVAAEIGPIVVLVSLGEQRAYVYRNGVEIGRAISQDAAARVSMPTGFARAVSLLLAPGATSFVTDAPILAENMHADITVLRDGALP